MYIFCDFMVCDYIVFVQSGEQELWRFPEWILRAEDQTTYVCTGCLRAATVVSTLMPSIWNIGMHQDLSASSWRAAGCLELLLILFKVGFAVGHGVHPVSTPRVEIQ